ncbi:hypothetical protein LPJ56_003393 [Coemansia sp. RSA 2599]|nr:hypothetical protein LPJ56_003393 [Coemansia sp. RSA 2599]
MSLDGALATSDVMGGRRMAPEVCANGSPASVRRGYLAGASDGSDAAGGISGLCCVDVAREPKAAVNPMVGVSGKRREGNGADDTVCRDSRGG